MDARCQEVSENQHRLHFCLVTETYPPEINGVAMTLHRLVKGMIDRGHKVSLIRPRQSVHDRPGCSRVPEQTLVPGIPIPGYQGLRFGLPVGKHLRRLWGTSRPDIIYVATEGPLGMSALRQAEKLNIPVVSGFHTNFHSYTSHYHIGFLSRLILSHLRNFHNRTRTTLVPGKDLQQQLQQARFNNVQILSRGVDCSLFNPDRRDQKLRQMWDVRDDQYVVLYVGRLATEKNLDLFIRTYRAMQQRVADLRCVMVGDGPLYRSLQQNNPDIIFCGMHTGRSLASHYASADMFLFPSETETFGNVTLEAMASGLVVVAYDYAAAGRHITNNKNGFVAPYQAEEQFIAQALAIVDGKTDLIQIRHNARTYALSVDWLQIIEHFENILRKNSNISQVMS